MRNWREVLIYSLKQSAVITTLSLHPSLSRDNISRPADIIIILRYCIREMLVALTAASIPRKAA